LIELFYTDRFALPLPEGHRFPMDKYRMLRERLVASGLVDGGALRVPAAATDAELCLAHDRSYVERVSRGELSTMDIRRIGFPWSPQLVERSRRSVGATIAAARSALVHGVAANLAGGTHHAFADHGEGYCVFNDVVVAARVLQREAKIARAIVIDCDVHQGNGTAALAAGDPSLFTFSIHSAKNFPFRKAQSDLDIALPDGTRDAEYLAALAGGLARSLETAGAELAFYVSGADPYAGDRLGRLALTKAGLEARDHLVLARCRERALPVAITMAGGYAEPITDIVDIHAATIAVALAL